MTVTVPYVDNTVTGRLTNSLLGTANGLIVYARQRMSAVDQFVSELSTSVLNLQAPSITPVFTPGASAPAISIPDAPAFSTPVWYAPGFPIAFTDVISTGDLEVEPFDIDPPVINYGTAPALFEGVVPDAPGVNLEFADPTLTVNLPAPPSLLSLSVEKFSGLNLPTFDAADPVLTAVEPSIREYVPGAQYTSALLSGLQATLLDRITTGGTGLSQEVENAIWDRGREREARSQDDAVRALEQMESLGYALPPGMYLEARVRILTESDYANRGLSREVMIKSAELQLDNVKHALTTATQLEGTLIDYTNKVEQRVFDATRYATEAGISIYNAKVQAYQAMVETYRAKVQAYQALVQAEVSRVEAYRAQIAAEQIKAQINSTLVEQYKVQADIALSNIEIYKAEIAGIQAKAQIEQTKVAVYGEQVRGFTARVNAYTAGVEAYRATIQGEAIKQEAYKTQVEGFSARVNASVAQINARIETYKARITAKEAEYEGYKAAVAGESARVDGIVRTNTALADSYRARVTGLAAFNDTLTKQWQVSLDQAQRVTEIGVSAAKANAELYISSRGLAIEAAKTSATVSAQLGAAAINAVNFSGSVSSSEGFSISNSASNSASNAESKSESDSTNYNYNASV